MLGGQRSETTGHQRIVIKECIFLSLRSNVSLNLSEKRTSVHSEHLLEAVLATRSVRADGWALPGGREWGWGAGGNMTERRMSSWHRARLM